MTDIITAIKKYKGSSVYFLIAANIVPLLGILFNGWNYIDVLLIYWLESVIVGFYNILKILALKEKDYKDYIIISIIKKMFSSIIFAAHFGGMVVLFGAMIYLVTSVFTGIRPDIPKVLLRAWPAILSLVISHGYSFIKNYYAGGERDKTNIRILMIQPYLRLLGMLAIIFIGAMLTGVVFIKFRHPLYFLVLFIILKTFVDLIGHIMERKKFSMAHEISSRISNLNNVGEKLTGSIIKRLLKTKSEDN